MSKKIIVFILAILPLSIFAQDKFAYIDQKAVLESMPEVKDVETKIANKREEITKTQKAIKDEYDKTVETYRNDTTAPSPSIVQLRQRSLEQIEERYQSYTEIATKEFQTTQQQLLAPLYEKLKKAIDDVGEEQGFTFIFEKDVCAFISPSAIDASELVKAKLNKSKPTGKATK